MSSSLTFNSQYLKRVHHRNEIPDDNAYIIYNIKGGIYWINIKDYPNFVLQWIGASHFPAFTMDLASARIHSIILDLDYISKEAPKSNIGLQIETILKMTFLPLFSNFTYIIAARRGSNGLHIHLPEFKIAYDDYIILCECLQYKFAMMVQEEYKLDIITNFMLPGAAKPGAYPYFPISLVYIDERNTYSLKMSKLDTDFFILKKKFAKRKDNMHSVFRNLLHCDAQMLRTEVTQLMMPVVLRTQTHTLMYATSIGKSCLNYPGWQDVGQFAYKNSKEVNFISKHQKLEINKLTTLKIYYYLKLNSKNIMNLDTNNHAIKSWFKYFNIHQNNVSDAHIPEIFRDIHEILQFKHTMLSDNPNPIKTVMQFNEGYYFLPVFYALCKHYKKNSLDMAQELYPLLDPPFYPLLDKIKTINPLHFNSTMAETSMKTIHFCANNLYEKKPESNHEKIKSIVENNQRVILAVTSQDHLLQLIRNIQDCYLPIRYLRLKNALKKPSRFIWNALKETWQEINVSSEITDHLQNLWTHIKQFLNEFRASGGMGGPDEDLITKFNIQSVIFAINSDTYMESKDIQMDDHKWLLRLSDGVLDVLTGHIGGVVPEFYLSERHINIGIPRITISHQCNHSPKHEELYEKLTDKLFFRQYLKALFQNKARNLFGALNSLLNEELDDFTEMDSISLSMMHFYINLCKITCFEYDVFMYLLDILASVYIGTNYERKFFVCKGLTRNGKSKLFELMGRILGGYYHSIQSENLTPGHTANSATPELASTLFSCRMVTSEELEKKINENRVKQITGNSSVAFRNMYEQCAGGIPTAKLFVSTNNYPECLASVAFKDRVVAIPFDADFVDKPPSTTCEQVSKNQYGKEMYVIEKSFQGGFFMLYYHLKKCITLDDGLLHYRPEPENIIEFTEDYLIYTDIYAQFKLQMDVQITPGSMISLSDVKSAIRQFLKQSKNTAFPEADLLICFEKEFSAHRRTDTNLGLESYNFSSVVDEPASKKQKLNNDTVLVIYEDIDIINLKKSSNYDN